MNIRSKILSLSRITLNSSFKLHWQQYQQRIERQLENALPSAENSDEYADKRLNEAMRYACLNGGKRFRATLVYACGELLGAQAATLDLIAIAIEMVHAYSLVHDDLPAMDNDALRRGQPTCHIAFDEATAILVGDALQSQAFMLLSRPMSLQAEQQLQLIHVLSHAIGAKGMCAGQALDMQATGQDISFMQLQTMHRLKTGALIEAAAKMAGIAAKADLKQLELLSLYGQKLGLCYQIVDDILDATATSEEMGKTANKDQCTEKMTYVRELGVERARAQAEETMREAIESARHLGDNSHFLQCLAEFVVNRKF